MTDPRDCSYTAAFDALTTMIERMAVGRMPGKLLYGSRSTLIPGDLYVLGFNPGGDPRQESANVAETLAATPELGWTEYTDASWRLRGKLYSPGEQPRQRKIQEFFRRADLDIKVTFFSNVLFVRDIDVQRTRSHESFAQLCQECATVHRFLLGIVKPKIVLCFGVDAFEFVRRMGLQEGRTVMKAPHFARGSNEAFFSVAKELRDAL